MSNCPKCNSSDVTVTDCRPSTHMSIISRRRRRLCMSCMERYTTYEIPEDILTKNGIVLGKHSNFEKALKLAELLQQVKDIAG